MTAVCHLCSSGESSRTRPPLSLCWRPRKRCRREGRSSSRIGASRSRRRRPCGQFPQSPRPNPCWRPQSRLPSPRTGRWVETSMWRRHRWCAEFDFQVQKARKPCRCQRITVWGRTTWSASRHPAHWCESHTQKSRSRRPNCGRFDRRRSRTSCCRSARFSSARSVRVLSDARSAPNSATTRDITSLARTPLGHRPVFAIGFWQRTGNGRKRVRTRSR